MDAFPPNPLARFGARAGERAAHVRLWLRYVRHRMLDARIRVPQARSRLRYLRRRMLDVRIRVPQVRPLLRSMWERALHPKRDQVFSLITAGIGGLIVIGFLAATDVEFRPPSVLAGAFTAEVGDNGLPYIAIDPGRPGTGRDRPSEGQREWWGR